MINESRVDCIPVSLRRLQVQRQWTIKTDSRESLGRPRHGMIDEGRGGSDLPVDRLPVDRLPVSPAP